MNRQLKTAASLLALSVAGVLAMPTSASAATLTATVTLSPTARTSFAINPGAGSDVNRSAGQFILERTGGDTTDKFIPLDANDGLVGDDIYAWCLQPNQTLASSLTWTVADLASAPVPTGTPYPTGQMGAAGASDMEKLVTVVNPDLDGIINDVGDAIVDSQADLLAGFQLAIWEIANEQSAVGYGLGTGDFQAQQVNVTGDLYPGGFSARSIALANQWLGAVSEWDDDVTLKALVNSGRQDLLVRVPDSGTEIPLPAAGWLFGSALLGGLGLARRRKQQA